MRAAGDQVVRHGGERGGIGGEGREKGKGGGRGCGEVGKRV